MHVILAIHNTYDTIECALYEVVQTLQKSHTLERLQHKSVEKAHASSMLVLTLDELLASSKKLLSDVLFIAVNRGPAPFTTLRVSIATVNGLAFAPLKLEKQVSEPALLNPLNHIPLVGVDALLAFAQEQAAFHAHTGVVLNAFNREVYYALPTNTGVFETGCLPLTSFIEKIKQLPTPIRLVGNGAHMFASELKEALGDKVVIETNAPDYCSIDRMALCALRSYNENPEEKTFHVSPLYLKGIR